MPSLLHKWRLMMRLAGDDRLPQGAELRVAMVLLDHCNAATGRCDPSLSTIARRASTTTRAVSRAISNLEKFGYFKSENRGWHRSNSYLPNFEQEDTTPASSLDVPDTTQASSENRSDTTPASYRDTTPASNKTGKVKPVRKDEAFRELALADTPLDRDRIEEAFETFWQQFPKQRRADRQRVLAKYRSIIKDKLSTPDELMGAVMAYGMSKDVAEGFACAPLRWLREERWKLDYRQHATPNPSGRTLADAAADMLGNTERAAAARRLARMEF